MIRAACPIPLDLMRPRGTATLTLHEQQSLPGIQAEVLGMPFEAAESRRTDRKTGDSH